MEMSRVNAEQRRLVLAYDGAIVIGAYRLWVRVGAPKANFPFLKEDARRRIGFEGNSPECWAQYLGKRIPPRRKGDS